MITQENINKQSVPHKQQQESPRKVSLSTSIDRRVDKNNLPQLKMHVSDDHPHSRTAKQTVKEPFYPSRSIEHPFTKKSIRKQSALSLKRQQLRHKKVLILYTSGSSGANENIQIHKGFLKARIKQNQYLFDQKMVQDDESEQSFLITPQQENGVRIFYQIQEASKIDPSINVSLEDIKQIAIKISDNYKKYDAFIVLCGFDVICYISTLLSFMLQNLSKLVIFTGGYFPIAYMRNDTVNNLNQSFSIISFADNFNDVIIVCKNKGYRANRSIKMTEGSFASVGSPNLEALVSVNIKIKFRENLYLPVPKQQFFIHTNISSRVGIIKFHILLSKDALEYELNNPSCDGFVIESYGSSNLPLKNEVLEVFKKVAEEKGKIFVNVGQAIKRVNSSIMKQLLEKYYIYFGGDMTTQAAISKLSYLLSKKHNRSEIKKLIYTNLRGQLTEMKSENQFQVENPSFIEIVQESLKSYYPSNYYEQFIGKIQNEMAMFISNFTNPKQIELIFKKVKHENREEQFKKTIIRLIDSNNLLHKAVQTENESLYKYFLNFGINYNKQDENQCSPLFYAIIKKDKKAIPYLSRKGCRIICPEDQLFDLFIRELKADDAQFFELLYHAEFKQTLRDIVNCQGRNLLHLASILKASKSLRYLLEKFKLNLKQKDSYGHIYSDYISAGK